MNRELVELEQAFRQNWRRFSPTSYAQYLERIDASQQLELLTRLLSVELEYAFQPPSAVLASRSGGLEQQSPQSNDPSTSEGDDFEDIEDDQRVRPCVPLFLVQFPELVKRSELVIRLIVLEYALRLRYDPNPPNPESYLPLCVQENDQLIRLLELTENKLPVGRSAPSPANPFSHTNSTIKEASLSASIALDSLPLNLGCFLLLRLLGRGGMGYVHAAIDLRSTAQVAVKVMRRVDAWSIYRFIEEFRWLSQLSHPHLVKLYDAFCQGDIRYFSMELVEGKMVREWFRQFPARLTSRWDELRRVLEQLASAVEYLHEHQVLHCDLKCSNMMITSGHQAVLLDLGLAIRAGQDNRLVGTLQYMAPEVIEGGPATYASDWYSFGVMIYEVLTDSFPPIQIDLSNSATRSANYQLDLEQVSHSLRNCPDDLASLCIDLLRANPAERPQAGEVVERLSGKKQPFRQSKQPLLCWGRESELATMHDASHAVYPPVAMGEETWESGASLIILQGESGSGKSTLLQHWAHGLPQHDSLLLSVRCYRQDHTPVRLLNALVQELTTVVRRLPPQSWESMLRKHAGEISVLFPQIQQLLPDEPDLTRRRVESHISFSEAAHAISLNSLVQWLLELSHQRRLILCVDDAQWADAESLRTLRKLLTHGDRFRGTLVLVDEGISARVLKTFQPDEEMSSDIRLLDNRPLAHAHSYTTTQIALQPLGQPTCHDLLKHWAELAQVPMNSSVEQDIAERSSGNPFLLQEIFRTYAHHVASADISGADWLTADSNSSVRRRFSMLPQIAENILQYLAVADHPVSFHQLQMISRILPHKLQRTLSWLATQGWISSRGNETESDVEIAHEKFRRAVLQSIPAERIHRRHYRLARILSCETPPPWARVAGHYWAAQYFREASSCYLEAARQAMSTGSVEEAIEFLSRAEHPDARRTLAEQQRVTRMKADCLARAGSSRAAAELYDRLLDAHLSEAVQPGGEFKDDEATMLRCLAGEQRIRAGELEAGLNRLQLALKQLGIVRCQETRFSRLCLSLRTWRLGLNHPLRSTPSSQPVRNLPFNEMERCLNRLSPPLTFLDNQLGPDLILRMARRAEQTGEPFDRSLALLRSGVLLSFAGRSWQSRALRRLQVGRRLARACRIEEARATGDFCMFVWQIHRGRFRAAARCGRRALAHYRNCNTSTQWEQQFLHWAMLGTYWYTTQLSELVLSIQVLRQSAQHRADSMSLFWMHVDTAHRADLIVDQPDLARNSLAIASDAIANQSFQSPRFFLWLSRIYQALYEDDAEQALDILETDWRHLNSAYIMRTNFYRWHALCARICCDLIGLHHLHGDRERLLRDARLSVQAMQQLEEPVFIAYARAFTLAIDAWAGYFAIDRKGRRGGREDDAKSAASWESTIAQLHTLGHSLLAFALQWHYSFHATSLGQPLTRQEDLQKQAEAALRLQGCIRPDKLLNMILPLPIRP